MKFSEIYRLASGVADIKNMYIGDVEFDISLDPVESKPPNHKRYFGTILDAAVTSKGITLLCEGELN